MNGEQNIGLQNKNTYCLNHFQYLETFFIQKCVCVCVPVLREEKITRQEMYSFKTVNVSLFKQKFWLADNMNETQLLFNI